MRERGGGWQQGEQKNDYAQNPIDLLMCERERATCYMRKLAPLFFFVFFGISHLALCVRAWKNVNELNQGQSRWKKCVENEMREKKKQTQTQNQKTKFNFYGQNDDENFENYSRKPRKKIVEKVLFPFWALFLPFHFHCFFFPLFCIKFMRKH